LSNLFGKGREMAMTTADKTSNTPNPAQQLISLGQSVWYDNISKELLLNGELRRLRDEWGVRGLTSNPTIFDQAIRGSAVYDSVIAKLSAQGVAPEKMFEQIAIGDIAEAADLLRTVYDQSQGNDGFVSIEVSPLLATDTQGTVEEAKRLFRSLNRPNIMIKVPGTQEGIPAVKTLLEEGVNVNVTLLFSVENYVAVAKTYCDALRNRLRSGRDVSKVRSVASFFVSRVDTIIDDRLTKIAGQYESSDPARAELALSLLGQFGIANCKLAYARFQQIFGGNEFAELRASGAAVQRPLWASTGTKNPKYSDVIYVDNLIGRDTVNTMPHKTLAAFVDHGVAAETLIRDLEGAKRLEENLNKLGVPVGELLTHLQVDGVKKFSDSFHSLGSAIAEKLKSLT